MPQAYFDDRTVEALTAMRDRALADRREERFAEFPTGLTQAVANTWRPAAVHVYRNWLSYLRARKASHRCEAGWRVTAIPTDPVMLHDE